MAKRGCDARQVSDQMSCHRCDLLWDINDQDPPKCLTSDEVARLRGERAIDNIRNTLHHGHTEDHNVPSRG